MLNKNLSGAFSVQNKSAPNFGTSFIVGADYGTNADILSEPTVLSALRLISSTISAMNIVVTQGDKRWDKYSTDLPGELAVLLRQPNQDERTKQLIGKIVMNLVRHNEAFIQVKGNSKSVRAIECLPKGQVSRYQDGSGRWTYQGTDNQRNLVVGSEIKWLSGPYINNDGFDFLEHGKKVVDLSVAAINNATAVNKKGPKVSGVVMSESKLTDEAYSRIRTQLDAMTSDDSAGQVAVLEKMTYVAGNQFSARDAQVAETRAAVSKDIASILNVPLQLLGYADSAYKDISELRAVFLSAVIDPIVTEIEDALTSAYGHRYTIDFDESDLLNAQFDLRAGVGMKMWSLGLIDKNEARDFADLPALKDGAGVFVAESNNLTFSDSSLPNDEINQ